jgi:hypothetical protein
MVNGGLGSGRRTFSACSLIRSSPPPVCRPPHLRRVEGCGRAAYSTEESVPGRPREAGRLMHGVSAH